MKKGDKRHQYAKSIRSYGGNLGGAMQKESNLSFR